MPGMAKSTWMRKMGQTWAVRNPALAEKMKAAKAAGLLYVEEQGRSNVACDSCGKSEMKSMIVSICPDKQTFEDDPCGGEVYIFGTTCWRAVKKEVGL